MKNINFKILIFLLFLNQSIFGMLTNAIEGSASNENISEDHVRVVLKYKALQDSIKVKLQTSVASEISQEWNVDWRDRKCSYCMEQLYQGDRDIHLFACGNPLHAAHPECYTRHREIRQNDNNLQPITCPQCRKVNPVRITSANTPEVTLSMARENFIRQTATLVSAARELAPREEITEEMSAISENYTEQTINERIVERPYIFESCCDKLVTYLSCNCNCNWHCSGFINPLGCFANCLSCNGNLKCIKRFSLYSDDCCDFRINEDRPAHCGCNRSNMEHNFNKYTFNCLFGFNEIFTDICIASCILCDCSATSEQIDNVYGYGCDYCTLASSLLCYVPFCALSAACPLTWWGTAYKFVKDCSE